MSDWIKNQENQETGQGNIAAAVAAAAAEATALTEYDYVPELDVHFDRTSGYVFKEGCHDFHHANSHYTYHFDESSSSWRCNYEPDWDRSVGCAASLDAFVVLSELLDRVEISENPPEESASNPVEVEEVDERAEAHEDEFLPCIRAIVMESDELPYGSLSIFTVDGGSIVREKTEEDGFGGPVPISGGSSSDMPVCHIKFDSETKRFQAEKVLTEGGEEEGELVDDKAVNVILNDVVLAKDPMDISHQDRLVVDCGGEAGLVILSLHIHKATNTCAGCEPGLLLSSWSGGVETSTNATISEPTNSKSKSELERDRRRELKRLKKKFALSRVDYVENPLPKPKPNGADGENYTDRADVRRRTVGSDLPQSAAEAAASRTASSSDKPVSEDNRGFKLLQKMGWKKGGGVGKREDGIKQPICPVGHMDSSGLGASTSLRMAVGDADRAQKRFKWSKAAQRYAKLEKRNVAFEEASQDDS